MAKSYRVLGIMSGTSLDGVDFALCTFNKRRQNWTFKIEGAKTIPYTRKWRQELSSAHLLGGLSLIELHARYGRFLGKQSIEFIRTGGYEIPDFISSHGHTIFHQPDSGFNFQLGEGSALAASSGLPVVCDFRSLDVQLGGQGAPLVPIGDRLLFSQYDVCVNLGGIANLSFERKGHRLAWDICFVNMGLNELAGRAGFAYDRDAKISKKGEVNQPLFKKLLGLHQRLGGNHPSLAREHFEKLFLPVINSSEQSLSLNTILRTFVEYASYSIAQAIQSSNGKTVLLTGGGAFHPLLVDRIRHFCSDNILIELGSAQIINYKEAVLFAFLGVLNREGIPNALRSVTGASSDSCGGVSIGF